jgi:MFS family permease
MSSGLRSVWALFVGVALLQLGHGLQGTLIGVEASSAQFNATVTGVIMSGFSVGLLLSAIVTPRIVASVGHIRVFAAFASVVSTAILLIPIWVNPVWWFAMRLIGGVCMAGLAIVAESWLNSAADNQNRGKMLSVYMVITYAAVGGGSILLNIADTSGFVRFIVVSALISLALVPISLAPSEAPSIEQPRNVLLRDIYKASPMAFVGTLAVGLGQSAFFAMGAVYGLMSGLSVGYVSLMMALPPIGVIFSQYPIGMLSDRFDRRIVLIALAIASALLALGTLYAASISPVSLIGLFAVFGAVSFPMYSLALAHANDYLEKDQMLGASSKLVFIYGAGAIAGPLLAGSLMNTYGAGGFMMFMLAVYGLLSVFGIYRMARRPETPESTGELIQVAPVTTPIAAGAIAEEQWEDEPAN